MSRQLNPQMKRLVACCCGLIMSCAISGQSDLKDQLAAIESQDSVEWLIRAKGLSQNESDSLLANWLLTKGSGLVLAGDVPNAIKYFRKAEAIGIGNGFFEITANAKIQIAERFRVQRKTDSAKMLINEVFDIADQYGSRKIRANAHQKLAILLDFIEEDPIASLEELHKARTIYEELEDTKGLAEVHLNIGTIYRADNNESQALYHYKEADKYFSIEGTITDRIRMAINIGTMHHFLGQLDSGKYYFLSADELIVDKDGMATAFLNVNYGNLLIDLKEFKEAYDRLVISNRIFTRIDDKYGMAITEYHIAESLLDSGNYRAAIPRFHKTLKMMDQYGINNIKETVFSDLAKAYAGANQFKKAYEYIDKRMQLFDSLDKADISKQIGILQKRYELSQKEAENEKLRHEAEIREADIQRQKELSVAGAIVLLFISAFAGFVFWSQRKTTKLNRTIQDQANKLKAINDAKSQLFANISHDFRTPLTLISGQVQLLLDDHQNLLPSDAIARLHKISWNNNRLISLTEEIRELISLDSGQIKIEKQAVSIKSFVALQTGLFQSAADEKGIAMNQTMESSDVLVAIDAFKMEKVFYNLLSNALKFTKAGGSIHVHLQTKKDHVDISVEDTGIGISAEHLDHVFDRYYQIESTDYKIEQGLGIGLAITKELVELHEGNISVKSHKGIGTTFTVRLPITQISEANNKILSRDSSTELPPGQSSRNLVRDSSLQGDVMVVDDHPEIRAYVRDLLEEDFNIILAENGWQALEILKEEKVDVIITDIMMPVMDGFVLIESLKENEKWKNIPVVAISARTGQEDKERVLKLGVADYMIKPFNSREFKLRITNLVELRKKDQVLPESLQHYNLKKLEEEWLTKLSAIVRDNLSEKVNNSMLANEMAMSERTLYRVLKDLTGLTPLEYVKQVKFQYARKLMIEGKVKSLNDAGKAIGMNNVTRFKTQYKAFYDEEPVANE